MAQNYTVRVFDLAENVSRAWAAMGITEMFDDKRYSVIRSGHILAALL
jgi:hypothetical protein